MRKDNKKLTQILVHYFDGKEFIYVKDVLKTIKPLVTKIEYMEIKQQLESKN